MIPEAQVKNFTQKKRLRLLKARKAWKVLKAHLAEKDPAISWFRWMNESHGSDI